eukprot:TRINITY_DN11613_c0_g1_i1.p2 TRINITY_DN11613_c0_g1~~TRINITY_DN11613_c0_g1_i1.p2  ORF type:complete len:432 (+),score=184.03 TRINITY_DN11613_c0_g1_i1:167-1462(+)
MQDGTSQPIQIGGGRASTDPVGMPQSMQGMHSRIDPAQASGAAFSLDIGGGSYMRAYEVGGINYDLLKIMYNRPARQDRPPRRLGDDRLTIPDVQKQLKERLLHLFQNQTCYDSLPTSSRIVVIDVTLPLRTAFISALENKVPFGILWDPQQAAYIGMMTVSDYIRILLKHEETRPGADGGDAAGGVDFHKCCIAKWREEAKAEEHASSQKKHEGAKACRDFLSARVDQDLLSALSDLHKHRIKRLPVVTQTGEVVSVLSLSVILNIIMTKMEESHAVRDNFADLLGYSVRELGIGTYYAQNTAWPKCQFESRVHDVLHTFMDYGVHCLPILDRKNRCIDVFTRNDVMFMENGGQYQLDITLATAVYNRPRHPVFCFSPDDTLYEVMRHLNACGVRTLIAVDESDKVIGQITLNDIFEWLLSGVGEAAPQG